MTMTLLGIDVSDWQGLPDWPAVAEAGITFAFAKATEGATLVDPSYAHNRAGIPAAGLVPGAYHLLTSTAPAAVQAAAFAAVADPDAVHALDQETAGLDVAGFVDAYRGHFPGHPLVIYTRRGIAAPDAAAWGPLWVASYWGPADGETLASIWGQVPQQAPGLPWSGWTSWTFWQFTSSAKVAGIDGYVDGDVFAGTLDQLQALRGATEMITVDLSPESTKAIANEVLAGRPDGGPYEVHDPDVPGRLLVLTDAVSQLLARVAQLQATASVMSAEISTLKAAAAAVTGTATPKP
jgi:lysozyme